MCSKRKTEKEIGKAIQEAIRAARKYKKRKTQENQSEYDERFATIYKYFYRQVYGIVRLRIEREEDVEELCNDIFIEIRKNLHKFK